MAPRVTSEISGWPLRGLDKDRWFQPEHGSFVWWLFKKNTGPLISLREAFFCSYLYSEKSCFSPLKQYFCRGFAVKQFRPSIVVSKILIMILLSSPIDYLPIAMMFVVAIGFVLFTMFVTHLLGPRRLSKVKLETFECGIESLGNARIPFSVKYFVVAILFVLFDVEVIFLYPWAVNFKELGMEGMVKMVIFMLLLLVGFFYIIKKKALEWE